MSTSNFTVLLGAIGTFAVAIWGVIHGHNSDRQELESYILTTVKQDNQQLRDDREADRKQAKADREQAAADLATLQEKSSAMKDELNQQIAQLKQRNAVLERENREYQIRYGKL
ncbi:hypothetical protein [Levilactobacillus lindianensis]|uniref:hypothetical protein n=1 Tax=Levilactobacillus lindianensis TaxID=2486018 RepID=UPI000F738F3E|nr:hypothetical protein [Levilactobacillus lindianensis]